MLALALLAAAGFAALGLWQLDRRVWKLDLIDRVEANRRAPPIALPPPARWRGFDMSANAYRRVTARGTFLHAQETLVQASTVHGPGFWVVTPLRTGRGIVLVNRGFVPSDRRMPAARAAAQTTAPVLVTGLIRENEPGGSLLRANDPAADRWYSRDVAAIARARGLARVAPFFIDADAAPNPGGYPIGGLTVVRFRNNHLLYALTWFALAALSLAAAALLLRRTPTPTPTPMDVR